MSTKNNNNWLTVKQYAELTGKSERHVWRLVEKGILELREPRSKGVKTYVREKDVIRHTSEDVIRHTSEDVIRHTSEPDNLPATHYPLPANPGEALSLSEGVLAQMQSEHPSFHPMAMVRRDRDLLDTYIDDLRENIKSPEVRKKIIDLYHRQPGRFEKGAFMLHLADRLEVNKATIYGWIARFKDRGINALAHKTRSDNGTSRKALDECLKKVIKYQLLISGEWNVSFAIKQIRKYLKYECPEIKDMLIKIDPKKDADAELKRLQSLTFTDYMVREWLVTTNIKDQHENKHRCMHNRHQFPSVRHDRRKSKPNVIWYIDDHDQDLLVEIVDIFGNVRYIRPKTIRVIDPATNQLKGWFMTDSAYGSVEIKKAIINAILWNNLEIPQQIYLECDKRMREGGILEALENFLGIEIYGTPYNPTAKANVEKSFHIDRLHLDSTFTSYLSNNPLHRPDKAEKRVKVTFAQYKELYDGFCLIWNNVETSVYGGGVRMTPLQMYKKHLDAGWVPTTLSEKDIEHLPYWFGKKEEKTVDGTMIKFTIDKESYYYYDTEDMPCLCQLRNKSKVTVRRHFEDLQTAYVYTGVYPNEKWVGRIQVFESEEYGFGKYKKSDLIEAISRLRKMKQKELNIDNVEFRFFEKALRKASQSVVGMELEQAKRETILLPRTITKYIPHLLHDPTEVSMAQTTSQLSDMFSKYGDGQIVDVVNDEQTQELIKKYKVDTLKEVQYGTQD